MSVTIRQATPADALPWLELVLATLGEEHPTRQVYDLGWIQSELDPAAGHETWIAVGEGKIHASISILGPQPTSENPVANLGRNLLHPDAYANGAAEALIRKIILTTALLNRMTVARLLASDNAQQVLFEQLGFVCVGFQPLKHLHQAREEVLFYVKPPREQLRDRLPISESLPQISELATAALANLQIPATLAVRDGVTGYPITTEITFLDGTPHDYESWRNHSRSANPPQEISGSFNWGFGFLRVSQTDPIRVLLGLREQTVVAGLRYYFDDQDRCVRMVDAFTTDDLAMGAMLNHLARLAQTKLNAAYVELDILITAPRLLKSAEQLGFIPVAYLPAFFFRDGQQTDVVKMVKLNLSYAVENTHLTTHARAIVDIVHHTLQDLKMGVAIINLLRTLKMFEGLGDGELRKIARLFTQQLFRPGDKIFHRDDSGNEAYVVLRGQVSIYLDEDSPAIATVEQGQIFGELAFLDGAPRGAMAVATQASILLVMQRAAYTDLAQREPHLGMTVMKNIAVELSQKLRQTNVVVAAQKP